MAQEVRSFAVAIPAGTPKTAPLTTGIAFPTRVVSQINWRMPPGPHGLVGWRLTMGGVQVVPLPDGAWLVADDDSGEWPLTGLPVTGQWELTGYNTGVWPHTVYLDFLLSLVTVPQPSALDAAVAPASADLLNILTTVSP